MRALPWAFLAVITLFGSTVWAAPRPTTPFGDVNEIGPMRLVAQAGSEEPAPPRDEPSPGAGEPSEEPAPQEPVGSEEPSGTDEPSGAGEPAGTGVAGSRAEEPAPPVEPAAAPSALVVKSTEATTQWGLGVHVRGVFLPTFLLNLFVDESTPVNSVAFGAEVVRRKGNLDIVGSIDFGFYSPKDGNYLGKGDDPSIDTDYVDFRNLNVLAFSVHFIRNEEILPWLSFVWGGGVGLAFVLGEIFRASSWDQCTRDNIDDLSQCHPEGMDPDNPERWVNDPANQGTEAEDTPRSPKLWKEDGVPPVLPLVHLLVGFNFKISDQFGVRLDGGFRNAFYVGATGHYFF